MARRKRDQTDRPHPERFKRGELERFEKTISDDAGRIAQPWRVIDVVKRLEREERIDAHAVAAAEKFHTDFYLAHLNGLKAIALDAIRSGGGRTSTLGVAAERAKRRVLAAIDDVGGPSTINGDCAWYVVGEGRSLAGWRERSHMAAAVPRDSMSGTLVSVLVSLSVCYGLRYPQRPDGYSRYPSVWPK